MKIEPLARAESLAALEWSDLLALVAALAGSDLGRAAALALAPATDRAALEVRRARYEEAERLEAADGPLLPSIETEIAPLLPRLAGADPPLDGRELLALADLLAATEAARRRVDAAAKEAPWLAERVASLVDPSPLVAAARRVLDRRGEVRDDASPRLVALRREIRRARDTIYRELEAVRRRSPDLFPEETTPLRGGRLLLLLASGAKGRVPGLLHARSATGRSFYFEPLEVVESNNSLAQASEEEEAERRRLLAELAGEFRAALPAIEAHAAFAAEIDLLQAAQAFARRCAARLPDLAEDGRLRLVGARHPLLEPSLAPLRESVLGSAGHRGAVVPLDLELAGDRRCLVVTGPNAGGKTVALKTVGLLALAAQSGLPVPAARGTAFPAARAIVASIGDEQDLLAERSTFSGRLLRLAEAWQRAGSASLVLVDELGSGTDPEEGAALAGALLERLAASGSLAVVTTHLAALAARALEIPGATGAAMEFEPESGRPTFRLLPGAPGGSEAIALARRLGLPAEWIERAEALVSPAHRNLERLLAEVERARAELASEAARARAAAGAAREAEERFEAERVMLETERRGTAARAREELAGVRERVLRELGAEIERLRAEWKRGRRRGLEREALERLLATAPAAAEDLAEGDARPLEVGAAVRHRALGWRGRLERLDGERAEVAVAGKRVRATRADLAAIEEEKEAPKAPRVVSARRGRPEAAAAEEADAATPSELMLIGERVDDALDRLDEFLDRALRAGRGEVRVVHGHGTGRLREAVRAHLRGHAAVVAARPGGEREGGNGATIVTLRS